MSNEYTGMVLYCDGGTYGANPAQIGYGVYSYTYKTVDSKDKGSKINKYQATQHGYFREECKFTNVKSKDELKSFSKLSKVSILNEEDHIYREVYHGSNNVAELKGLISALSIIKDNPGYDHYSIRMDNKGVIKGYTEHLENWVKNRFIKSDGEPVKNLRSWEIASQYLKDLKDIPISINWVKAHDGEPGNERADMLATMSASEGKKIEMFKDKDMEYPILEKVSTATNDKVHPLLNMKRFYFNPQRLNEHFNRVKLDEPVYYFLGNTGKDEDDEELGKEVTDTSLAICKLNHSDVVLDTIMTEQKTWIEYRDVSLDVICVGMLSDILKSNTYDNLRKYQSSYIRAPESKRMDLCTQDKVNITLVMDPPFLSMRILNQYTNMDNIVNTYLENRFKGEVIDITDMLFEKKTITKKGGYDEVYSLKSDITQELDYIKVNGLNIAFNQDILSRNTLKKLEKLIDKVLVLIHGKDDNYQSYSTLTLLTTGEWCIYQSSYTANFYKRKK